MIATASSIAVDHAKQGRRVALCCPPDQNGACSCGGTWDDKLHQLVPHTPKEVGKAPIGRFFPKGINDATTNTAKLDGFLRKMPDANVSIEVQSAKWLIVDTDSAETETAELAHGLDGAVVRESRHRAYVFLRPDDCPIVNLIKKDGDALDILTFGNFLVHGTHASGARIRLDPNAKPGQAPPRYVEMLKAKAAADAASIAALDANRAEWAAQYGDGQEPPVRLHQRGLRRWRGELVEAPNGELDRDLSLWYIGLDLAECGATRGAIVEALKERDIFLGWEKFTRRKDDREYVKIAEKVVASAIEKQQAPQLKVSAPADVPDDVAALRAALEAAEARITYLERANMDRDDRLEVLEDIVHSIDDVLNLPNEEMSASDKVILIGTARWLPYYRSKKEANGQPSIVAVGYVAKVCGSSKSTVSATLKRFSSVKPEDGAPFLKIKHRKAHVDEDGHPVINPKTGKQLYTTPVEFVPLGQRPAETLRAAVAHAQVNRRKKHGGSQEASDVRWGRCDKHDNDYVRVKGYCPDCGQVVGERIVTLAEFDLLDEQVAHPEGTGRTVSNANLIGKQVAHPDHAHGPAERLNLQVVDSEPPRSLLDYAATRPQEPPKPWRCHCGSLERYPRPGGGYRCDGCGDVTLPAVSGAET